MWLVVVLVAVLALSAGYWYGAKMGYAKAQAEVKVSADAAAKKAAEKANPFNNTQANPLGNIKVNPFK